MAIQYKQKCSRCNKNYVPANYKSRYVLCYDCQKKELAGEITDPKMVKFFNIPEELYEKSSFLRSIKLNYLRYGDLSTPQKTEFKRVADELSGKAPKSPVAAKPKKKAKEIRV